jgi:hypothetical protein
VDPIVHTRVQNTHTRTMVIQKEQFYFAFFYSTNNLHTPQIHISR